MAFVPPVARTTLPKVYPEGASCVIWATLLDEDGISYLPNASGVLDDCTLDLYEDTTKSAINGCVARNILNANGGSVYDTLQTKADGTTYNLKIRLSPADMACLLATPTELHVALIRYPWGSGTKMGIHEIAFTVANLSKVGSI